MTMFVQPSVWPVEAAERRGPNLGADSSWRAAFRPQEPLSASLVVE